MTLKSTTYVGVDLSTGQRPFTFAALDENQRMIALGEGEMLDSLSYIAGLPQALVAVNSPSRPNSGWMADADVRRSLDPPPDPYRWRELRVGEYELALEGVDLPRTPRRLTSCPHWMRGGFRFYERMAAELACPLYPVEESPRQCLEFQADAAFANLLGLQPFAGATLEGRIQRQLLLADLKLGVPDAMDFFEEVTRYKLLHGILPTKNIHTTAELNAMVGAYTAWMVGNLLDEVRIVGRPDEGLIYLPCRPTES